MIRRRRRISHRFDAVGDRIRRWEPAELSGSRRRGIAYQVLRRRRYRHFDKIGPGFDADVIETRNGLVAAHASAVLLTFTVATSCTFPKSSISQVKPLQSPQGTLLGSRVSLVCGRLTLDRQGAIAASCTHYGALARRQRQYECVALRRRRDPIGVTLPFIAF